MILDERLELSDAGTLATATGTALHGDVIDFGGDQIGDGEPMYLVIQVTTAVTSAGAATVKFELASDAAAAIATDGSATVHAATEAIGKASLVAGYTRVIPLPPAAGNSYERYVGVLTTVGTAALTAGAVNAFLTKDVARWQAYADASN
jgi:hypothetical protein